MEPASPPPPRKLPLLEPGSAFYWTSGAEGTLRIQRCTACGTYQHPPFPRCAACGSEDSLTDPTQLGDRIYRAARALFDQAGNRGPFRLIGVGISDLAAEAEADLSADLLDPTARQTRRNPSVPRMRSGRGLDEAIIKGRALR